MTPVLRPSTDGGTARPGRVRGDHCVCMTQRFPLILISLALLALAFFVSVVQSAVPARALAGNGHGPGYMSSDGWWLGTYSLDDGSHGFCLHAGKDSPTGHVVDYAEGQTLGWYTPEQGAALAYISRNWAGTTDRAVAAAGQIATWMVAGLGGHTAESYAARAGADAGTVLEWATAMSSEALRLGSRSVAASAVVELADQGPGRLRVDLTADRLNGSGLVSAHSHQGTVELKGATFADGSTVASVWNGEDVEVLPTGTESSVSVAATVRFDELPYGDRMKVAVPRTDAQSLLIAVPASATASTETSTVGVSPLPFQPVVSTITNVAEARPGALVSDHLFVTVRQEEDLLPVWGVWQSESGFVPVSATVRSRLLGPFAEPIEEAETAPDDAPEVCTVELTVTAPGEFDTPECELPGEGWYVWVETIEAAHTDTANGGSRLRDWRSRFGVASEVTHVTPTPAPPAPVPPAPVVPELPIELAPPLPAPVQPAPLTPTTPVPAPAPVLAVTGSSLDAATPVAVGALGAVVAGAGILVWTLVRHARRSASPANPARHSR